MVSVIAYIYLSYTIYFDQASYLYEFIKRMKLEVTLQF